MKIGIATLFAPSNYGNALQMLSLQRYLLEHGHDAEVLSHWLSTGCDEVNYYHNRLKGFGGLVKFAMNCFALGGVWENFIRESRVKDWVKAHLRMSVMSGDDATFEIDKVDYDLVIAGSDQIWNPDKNWPEFNLLGGLANRIDRIAYAASFGTDDREHFEPERFVPALKRFNALSVRESSAKAIIADVFGLTADLVCDPVLLHTKEQWVKILGINQRRPRKRGVLVYMVAADFRGRWRELIKIARQTKSRVDFFAFASYSAPGATWRNPFSAMLTTIKNICRRLALWIMGVRYHLKATPTEFIDFLSNSEMVLTDSFHGMVFSAIFEKRCNVFVGQNIERETMSARLRDFIAYAGLPDVVTKNPDVNSAKELCVTQKLTELICFSKKWLDGKVDKV